MGWLLHKFWGEYEKSVSSEVIKTALGIIEAKARFEGKEYLLHNRVAVHGNEFYYDLTDASWRAVVIGPNGWHIDDSPPILFNRYTHQQAQVTPIPGGDLHDFLKFVNISDDGDKLLFMVTIVACFIPGISHTIPVIYGPQGSAKTTLARMTRRLTDPSATEILSFPSNKAELIQQLSHHWAPFYDNVTTMPEWLSDMLCRAVTGEGFSKRQNYSDDDDIIYSFQRCVGLNGINVVPQKADLLDRSILFKLETISPNMRKPEQQIWAAFEEKRPFILDAIFDTLSKAMAIQPSVKLAALPRMADFAVWGCAIAEALGYKQVDFLSAFSSNARVRNSEAINSNPVAMAVITFMDGRTEWRGTASELLSELNFIADRHRIDRKQKFWPKAPHILTRRLNEAQPNLRAIGIQVVTGDRASSGRSITIHKDA